LQNGGEFQPGFIFQRINPWTGSMPLWTGWARSVHHGPTAAWTEGGPGHGGVLTGARPPVTPVRQSSPAGAQQREERIESSSRASPGLGWCWRGLAMVVKVRRCRCSVRGLLRRGERGKGAGRGAVKLGGGACLLYGAGRAPGRGGQGV
jgi:hypothetical protein